MAAKKVTITKGNLPKQWTTAKVRVNGQGNVQVKINPAKLRGNPSVPTFPRHTKEARKAWLQYMKDYPNAESVKQFKSQRKKRAASLRQKRKR